MRRDTQESKNGLFAAAKSDYTGGKQFFLFLCQYRKTNNHLTKNEENGDTSYGNP